MPVTFEDLRTKEQDYLLASWEDGELVMVPHCSCGNELEENYTCKRCNRDCNCTFIACADPQAMSLVERLLAGNPNFKNFSCSLIEK